MNALIYFKVFLKRIFFLICLYSASRLYLFLNNLDSFSDATLWEFLEGLRFDFSALLYINIPLLILLLFPTNSRARKSYRKLTNFLFYAVNIPFIMLNNVDIEYFRFTQKRSTIDLFQLLQLGNDAKNIIPQYLKDYWLITLFTFLQIWILLKIKYIPTDRLRKNAKSIFGDLIVFLLAAGLFISGSRGGLQLKPIKPINAGELSNTKNSSLILNTPFCIFHSINTQNLEVKQYFSDQELTKIYSTFHHYKNLTFQKKNVIVIIMESLSREFVGELNNGNGHTPFLDSLMQKSLIFENAFASGIKSIEGLPSITASIPTFMDNPFITSNYAQNNFESLASLLSKEGYKSTFFHGGFTGTMGFDSYCRKAGYAQYFGLEEYNNMEDYDGTWGIYDEEFFGFYSDYLKSEQEPFFSTFFSVTLHPPFVFPEKYEQVFLQEKKVHQTVAYVDYALQTFFKKASKEDWYKNTIFVITADHTCGTRYVKKYKNKIGRYAIPMVIFKGDSSLQENRENIVQQIDIMPTILELLGYNKPFSAFGKSMLSDESWALSYLQNNYSFISEYGILTNKGEEYKMYSDWQLTEHLEVNKDVLMKLKAIKQSYNQRMINNKLMHED
ncbi:MAG: sulfatase-like hydrolase/transferase [Bacteroidota bacterium]|nr:sulfatase-like hydrolase/transferase [Bacteroidota bacterium]